MAITQDEQPAVPINSRSQEIMEIANLCATTMTDVYDLVHPELKGR
jgi:hypothetical protein